MLSAISREWFYSEKAADLLVIGNIYISVMTSSGLHLLRRATRHISAIYSLLYHIVTHFSFILLSVVLVIWLAHMKHFLSVITSDFNKNELFSPQIEVELKYISTGLNLQYNTTVSMV